MYDFNGVDFRHDFRQHSRHDWNDFSQLVTPLKVIKYIYINGL